MGIGIWSMHYIGMLAFGLPVPIQYDWPTALLSLFAGIFSSLVALVVVSRQKMGPLSALVGSVFMGGGIVAMHYIAMFSMRPRGHVPLFSVARGSFGPARGRWFLDGLIASVLRSGRGAGPVEAEDCQRVADGGHHRRHAL
jgi:hypothetical protein